MTNINHILMTLSKGQKMARVLCKVIKSGLEKSKIKELVLASHSADGNLSLLRYRLERTIPWNAVGIPTKFEVDRVIGRIREAISVVEKSLK